MAIAPVNDKARFGQQAQAANPQGSDPMQNKNKTGLPGVAKPGMLPQPALKKPGSFNSWQTVARPIGGNLSQNIANFEAKARNNRADNKLLEIPGGEGEPGGGPAGGQVGGKGGGGAAPGTAEANVKPNTPLPGSNIVPPTPTPSPGTFQGTTGTAGQAGAGKSGGGAAPPGGQLGGISQPGRLQSMDQPPPGGWPYQEQTGQSTVPTGKPAGASIKPQGGGGAK